MLNSLTCKTLKRRRLANALSFTHTYTRRAELFPDSVKLRIRFSLNNLKLDGDVLNIPLFMADETDRLIGLALDQRSMAKE